MIYDLKISCLGGPSYDSIDAFEDAQLSNKSCRTRASRTKTAGELLSDSLVCMYSLRHQQQHSLLLLLRRRLLVIAAGTAVTPFNRDIARP